MISMVRGEQGLEPGLDEVEARGSRGEKQIARMLTRYGVRYVYEHPVAVLDRGRVRVWYPDLWLPDYGIVIEYAGSRADKDYVEGIEHKKAVYEVAGFPAIFLDAGSLSGGWPRKVIERIGDIVKERARKFDSLDDMR